MGEASSIIIPCYNQSQYLCECLQSLMTQTVEDWEAIVVDDASTEGNVSAIVESFHDERIHLIRHKQNRGLAASRNTGVRNSSAPIIAPLDADDKFAPTYLEVTLQNLGDESVHFVYFDIQCIGNSSAVRQSKPFDPVPLVREVEYIQAQAPFRKMVWERCGGWCEEPVFRLADEDVDFWYSVVERGFTGKYVTQPLYHYRVHNASMSAQPRIFVLPIYRRLFERHTDLILRYSPYSEWIARGWLEVGRGYLKLRQPHLAFACGMWAWLTSSYRRPQAMQVIRSSLWLALHRIASPIKSALPTAKHQKRKSNL